MLSVEIKDRIKKNLDDVREQVSEKITEILQFPYHPDTRMVLFQLHVVDDSYGVIPIPLEKPYGAALMKDVNGPVDASVFQQMSFACLLLDGIDIEWDDESDDYDEDFIDELETYAKQAYAGFIGNLFDQKGGQGFLIPCVFQQTDARKVYHLQSKRWIEEEEVESLV